MTTEEIIKAMELRFTSANSVPVERAHIRADEWKTLCDEHQKFRGLLVDALVLFQQPQPPEINSLWMNQAGKALYPEKKNVAVPSS